MKLKVCTSIMLQAKPKPNSFNIQQKTNKFLVLLTHKSTHMKKHTNHTHDIHLALSQLSHSQMTRLVNQWAHSRLCLFFLLSRTTELGNLSPIPKQTIMKFFLAWPGLPLLQHHHHKHDYMFLFSVTLNFVQRKKPIQRATEKPHTQTTKYIRTGEVMTMMALLWTELFKRRICKYWFQSSII